MLIHHLICSSIPGNRCTGLAGLFVAAILQSARGAESQPPSALASATGGLGRDLVAPAMALGGAGDSILDGFDFSAFFAGTYNSNVTYAPGGPLQPEKDDFFLTAGGGFTYLSKAREWTLGAGYLGSYDSYFTNSEYSGLNHDVDASVNYNGGRLRISLKSEFDITRGGDRSYPSSFVELSSFSNLLTARFQVSPKTILSTNVSQKATSPSGNFGDTEALDLGTSVLWKFSPLTEIGPGIRYTYRTGSTQTSRTSIGPTLNTNYKLSAKVAMNSRIGVDFARYNDGTTADPTLAAAIGLNYNASKLWSMNFSLFRDHQADPSTSGAFYEVTAARLGYKRKVRRATVNLGIGYETTAFDTATVSPRPDREYFSVDGSVTMPVLAPDCEATLFMRHSDQKGSPLETWDAFQAGVSLTRKF